MSFFCLFIKDNKISSAIKGIIFTILLMMVKILEGKNCMNKYENKFCTNSMVGNIEKAIT
jgi:hypothetical protein